MGLLRSWGYAARTFAPICHYIARRWIPGGRIQAQTLNEAGMTRLKQLVSPRQSPDVEQAGERGSQQRKCRISHG
jgi:hypothetical protein